MWNQPAGMINDASNVIVNMEKFFLFFLFDKYPYEHITSIVRNHFDQSLLVEFIFL